MLLGREEMLLGMDRVDVRLIETLKVWLENESQNLQGFLENPEGHVNFNPYVNIHYTAFYDRVFGLEDIIKGLDIIIQYKHESDIVTRSMYELAVEQIPCIICKRLLDWMIKRKADMEGFFKNNSLDGDITPLPDYVGMFDFNEEAFMPEYTMYTEGVGGLEIVCQYKTEQDELLEEPTDEIEYTPIADAIPPAPVVPIEEPEKEEDNEESDV